jgi:DNA modification methylase
MLRVSHVKDIIREKLAVLGFSDQITVELPEFDDRYNLWRCQLTASSKYIGEVSVCGLKQTIIEEKTTDVKLIQARLEDIQQIKGKKPNTRKKIQMSPMENSLYLGDSESILKQLPEESINLVFTSPPYYNAKVEYSEYLSYENYLDKLQRIIRESHRVLSEGRFFVINVSPILIRRANRGSASTRLALPFDIHGRMVKEGFDFIDDIIWEKPEGAGWALGRGRRFSADRNPLQYKPVVVTEYLLVYRKHTENLIDWNIRQHPDPQSVQDSKIEDGYEKTNVWKITPSRNKHHPAVFPIELVNKVITYYSFKNDVVLDPFAGSGTVGTSAQSLDRRFVLIESNETYFDRLKQQFPLSKSVV